MKYQAPDRKRMQENPEKEENPGKPEKEEKPEMESKPEIEPKPEVAAQPETTTAYFLENPDKSTDVLELEGETTVNDFEADELPKEVPPKEPSSVEELSDIMSSIKKQFFHNMIGL